MIQLPAILITLGLAAALVNPEAPRRAEPDSPPAVAINQLAAPAHMTATWPEDILDATRAAKTDIAYTPGDEQTWYFNAGGNPVDQASAGGYYRKALGKTADGRLVVQDYYQDSGKPQTAPFILKKDSDPHDFDSNSSDSKTVWYREDGSVQSIQDYRDGKESGRHNFYQNGRLAVQLPKADGDDDPADDPYNRDLGEIGSGLRLYYPSGKLMAILQSDDDGAQILYREDGSPLIAVHNSADDKPKEVSSWDKDGNLLDNGPAPEELAPIRARGKELLDLVKADLYPVDSAPAALPEPVALPGLLPENILDARQAGATTLDYTPQKDGQTWYFDANNAPVASASPGGYYRKALGKTADGRLVAQDYYQDSHSPQTAPFILVKDADPHDFDTTTADSKVVWYRKDGSISSVQTFAGGKAQSRMNIYLDGRLAAQMPRPEHLDEPDDPYRAAGELADGIRYYHDNGHLLYLYRRYANESSEVLYDRDGKPLAAWRERADAPSAAWNITDEHSEKRGALDEAIRRRDHIQQMLEDEDDASPDGRAQTGAEEEKPAAASPAPSQP